MTILLVSEQSIFLNSFIIFTSPVDVDHFFHQLSNNLFEFKQLSRFVKKITYHHVEDAVDPDGYLWTKR